MAYNDIDSGKVLNKEGLLELCNQIKTEMANNSGGGSSYTAGNGLYIDENDVINISQTIFTSKYAILFSSGNMGGGGNALFGASPPTTRDNVNDVANDIKTYGLSCINGRLSGDGITPANLNEAMGTTMSVYKLDFTVSTDTLTDTLYLYTNTNRLDELRKTFYIIKGSAQYIVATINTVRYLIGAHLARNITFPQGQNYTAFRLGGSNGVIRQLDNAISTKLTAPTPPTADGTYTLQCVVSSGTPTYSWVSV